MNTVNRSIHLACNASRMRHKVAQPERPSDRLFPSLFVPGMPKAGTTFVWDCAVEAFRPERVCESNSSRDWAECGGRQYVLPVLVGLSNGFVKPAGKEPFIFSRGHGLNWTAVLDGDASALARLRGPAMPLCQWELNNQAATFPERFRTDSEAHNKLQSEHNQPGTWLRALELAIIRRREQYCVGQANSSRRGSAAPLAAPSPGSCLPDHRTFHLALPVASALKSARAMVMDATPNYLTSPHALTRIHWLHSHALDAVRILVCLRDPIERAYSEYRMFVAWGWDRGPFEPKASQQMQQLAHCWASKFALGDGLQSLAVGLHERGSRLSELAPDFVRGHLLTCFDYGHVSTRYIRNSMPELGLHLVRSWLPRRQLMFLWMEDLREMRGSAIVEQLAAFTGLTARRLSSVPPTCEASFSVGSTCQGTGYKQRCQHFNFTAMADEARAGLRQFFLPTLVALEALIQGSFEASRPLQTVARLRLSYTRTTPATV